MQSDTAGVELAQLVADASHDFVLVRPRMLGLTA